jgi:hypothetical protein
MEDSMRRLLFVPVLLLAPALAFAQYQNQPTQPQPQGVAQPPAASQSQAKPQAQAKPITCDELPKAEAFVNSKLKPGPNTEKAKQHLALAKSAKSNAQCTAQLKQVDYYAKRSLAADKKTAVKSGT